MWRDINEAISALAMRASTTPSRPSYPVCAVWLSSNKVGAPPLALTLLAPTGIPACPLSGRYQGKSRRPVDIAKTSKMTRLDIGPLFKVGLPIVSKSGFEIEDAH